MPTTAPTAIAVIGIDIGKNSFHIVGLDDRVIAARAAYKGPDVKGARCRVWAEREASDLEQDALI